MASLDIKTRPFEATPVDDIAKNVARLRTTYRTTKTKDMQFRLKQIRKLYWGLVEYTPLMEEALMKDMRKSQFEANISDIDWCKQECLDVINSAEKWAKDEPIKHVPLMFWALRHRIRYEPLGIILIMGAYNYPFMLNITPIVGAIAAGNCVVLKPNENSPHSAMVLQRLFEEYLDPDCYTCVNGDVPVTKALLEQKYDKIIFTGGNNIGTLIAKKAAETLTPVILELGGQNPAFVTPNANVKLAARRLLWQKTLNAGQVCLSHNYALVHRSILTEFIEAVNASYKSFMPNGGKASSDLSRIVNKAHFHRIKKMLDNTKGRIVMGGAVDESDLFIEPTVVLVDSLEDSMMVEESFGPIWSVLAYDSLDEAIDIANKIDPTPLALSTFGSDAETEKILRHVTSGGATINDGCFHATINAAPLGGVGSSGMGNYHGVFSFRAFSHARVIASVPSFLEKALDVRYMPYSMKQLGLLQNHRHPGFDRDGNVTKGLRYWLGVVFRLGGPSPSAALVRNQT